MAYKQFTQNLHTPQTPQSEPIPGTNQARNNAGGYSFQIDAWDRLHRFLILGSEGGSYYATERALTAENAHNAIACIKADGQRVVRETTALSDSGRAPKNDPAIFTLALCAALGDPLTRRAALEALPQVCRTGTHLFQFAGYVQSMRGWGRGLRRGIADWYNGMEPRDLAYQVIKYRQREGWTHLDLLRLAHPTPNEDAHSAIYRWIAGRSSEKREPEAWATALTPPDNEALTRIWAFEKAQTAADLATILQLIDDYDLPREALPTEWLNQAAVWERLLQKMPMTAMIRNLGVMSKVGLIAPLSDAESLIVKRLSDRNALRKARIHPIMLLSALRVYARGRGVRGSSEWTASAPIIDALDEAFYMAFDNVEPTGKRFLIALDVSGSMGVGEIAGVPGLTPREASAALALVTARTEAQYGVIAFQTGITPLNGFTSKLRLDSAIQTISGLPFGGTDCAQPMLYALEHKITVDTFVVITDNETWAGGIHPSQALVQYREQMGIPARLIVVGMTATQFSIADPNDAGMLDVVGFDAAAPQIMADFARGTL
ncbi:MAG: TROVE domain-containing protein [Anaerolineae bacterium]